MGDLKRGRSPSRIRRRRARLLHSHVSLVATLVTVNKLLHLAWLTTAAVTATRTRFSRLLSTTTAACPAMAPVHHCQPLSGHGDDAEAITRLFREGGPGTTVLLHQRATYVLRSAIDLVHPDTTLATMGYPDFSTGDQAILETRGDKEATAVNMFNKRNTSLKRVHLRGCRGWGRTKPESDEEIERLKKEGKLGWIEGGGSLVWMGGPDSSDSIVEGCRIEDPRGWTGVSALLRPSERLLTGRPQVHLCDFAIRNRLVDNIVGPCGQEGACRTCTL